MEGTFRWYIASFFLYIRIAGSQRRLGEKGIRESGSDRTHVLEVVSARRARTRDGKIQKRLTSQRFLGCRYVPQVREPRRAHGLSERSGDKPSGLGFLRKPMARGSSFRAGTRKLEKARGGGESRLRDVWLGLGAPATRHARTSGRRTSLRRTR